MWKNITHLSLFVWTGSRDASLMLKVRNCKVPQCALVSVYISVGLRHAMTETFSNCHFWTCFAMSKPKETMCRIRLWTNKEQTADRTKFGRKPKCLWKFNQLYPQACTPNEQFVSQRDDFNRHHTALPNFHPTSDPTPEPAGSAVSHQPHNLRVKMLSTTSWEKSLDAFWFGKGLEKFLFDDKEFSNSVLKSLPLSAWSQWQLSWAVWRWELTKCLHLM